MSDFHDRTDAARRQGRLDGLRLACKDVARENYPRLSRSVLRAISSEERDHDRLLRWIVAAGRKPYAEFSRLVLAPVRRRGSASDPSIKLRPFFLLLTSGVIITGMWFERILLIAPSLSKGGGMNLGLPEALVSGGFLGAVSLTVLFFLRRYPLLPVSDPLFRKSLVVIKR